MSERNPTPTDVSDPVILARMLKTLQGQIAGMYRQLQTAGAGGTGTGGGTGEPDPGDFGEQPEDPDDPGPGSGGGGPPTPPPPGAKGSGGSGAPTPGIPPGRNRTTTSLFGPGSGGRVGEGIPVAPLPGPAPTRTSSSSRTSSSIQTLTGQAVEPQLARVPGLNASRDASNLGGDISLRVPAWSGPGVEDDYRRQTGYDGELVFDGFDPTVSTSYGTHREIDYNAMTWRFDGRDRIWKPLQALGTILTGDPDVVDAEQYAEGTLLFYPTTGLLYYATYQSSPATSRGWNVLNGQIKRGTLAAIPTWGTAEAGGMYYATDYAHLYYWSGTAWSWGPGDTGSGYIAHFIETPRLLTQASKSWQLCDATATVNIATATGGTTSVSVPHFQNGAYILADNNYNGPNVTAASAFNTSTPSAGVKVQSGTDADVPDVNHTHTVTVPKDKLDHMEFKTYLRR